MTTQFDATPRFEYEELKQITGQHVRVLKEQRRHTQLIGDSAKQRLKQRLKERIKTEERRRSSMMFLAGGSSENNAAADNATTFSEFMAATDGQQQLLHQQHCHTPGGSGTKHKSAIQKTAAASAARRPFGRMTTNRGSPMLGSPHQLMMRHGAAVAATGGASPATQARLNSSPMVGGGNPLTVMAAETALRVGTGTAAAAPPEQQLQQPQMSSPVVLAKAPLRRLDSSTVKIKLSSSDAMATAATGGGGSGSSSTTTTITTAANCNNSSNGAAGGTPAPCAGNGTSGAKGTKKKRDFLHMFKSRRDRNGLGAGASAKQSRSFGRGKNKKSIFGNRRKAATAAAAVAAAEAAEAEEPEYIPPKPEMVVHMACQNACDKLSRGEIDQDQLKHIVDILMETQKQTCMLENQHLLGK